MPRSGRSCGNALTEDCMPLTPTSTGSSKSWTESPGYIEETLCPVLAPVCLCILIGPCSSASARGPFRWMAETCTNMSRSLGLCFGLSSTWDSPVHLLPLMRCPEVRGQSCFPLSTQPGSIPLSESPEPLLCLWHIYHILFCFIGIC